MANETMGTYADQRAHDVAWMTAAEREALTSRMSVSPDQLASAGAYIAREWGDHGYQITHVATPLRAVTVFHVEYVDGSRFAVAVDRWSNARTLPDDMGGRIDVVREMHARAVTP